jgi:hypothetical protein
MGRPRQRPDVEELDVDVNRLLERALEKETDGRPFIVCIDLNLPPDLSTSIEDWARKLHDKVLSQHGSEATGEPDRFSATLFTNYSWHWDGRAPAGNPLQVVVGSNDARVPIPLEWLNPIAEAVLGYGDVPS